MYKQLNKINHKPKAFEFYSADSLWTDPHRAQQMLAYHLNSDIEAASRNVDFIDNSVEWLIKYFADSAGKKAGEFYTPSEVVRLCVEI